jgi:2-C-methyl-D-erythritol 4-phosphate cytidylyltransferase
MSAPQNNVWTIVVAGGSGSRFGGLKQFAELSGRRMVDWAVETAAKASNGVVVVVPAGLVDDPEFRAPVGATHVVAGGSTRSESVRCGLARVPNDVGVICVHDAARPFATTELFARVIGAITDGVDAAIPGIDVTDTIKVVDPRGRVTATPDRAALRAVQTPQAFRGSVLRAAHAAGGDATDDAAVVEANGGYVVVVSGEADNRKITNAADLEWARSVVVAR